MSGFCLQSAYKYQEEGSAFIRAGAKIVVGCALKELDKTVYLDITDDMRDVAGSFDNKLVFTISQYSQEQPEEHQVCCGDYLQLIHSEENACLIAERNGFDKSVVELRLTHEHSNINSIWILEYPGNRTGGGLETGGLYSIRHLSSGLYLTVDEGEGGPSLGFSRFGFDSQWNIVQNKTGEKVFSEKFYRFQDSETGLTLGAVIDLDLQKYETFTPSLTTDQKNVSYFRLKKCFEYFSSVAVFLVNSVEVLGNLLEGFKELLAAANLVVADIMKCLNLIEKSLNRIEMLCQNKLKKLVSVDVTCGDVDSAKQSALRDVQFISSLTEVLQFFANFKIYAIKNIDAQKLVHLKIKSVLSSIFRLITLMCLNKKENQEEAFANISTYCKFIDKSVGANEFLISLVKNNENILYKMHYQIKSSIKSDTISWFIHQLRVILT